MTTFVDTQDCCYEHEDEIFNPLTGKQLQKNMKMR